MHAFNSSHADNGESRAFAIAHAAAKRCMEAKALDVMDKPKSDFRIFSAALTPIASDDGKRRLRTIASSTVEDLGGDEISPKALQAMAATAKGMSIFRNHSYKIPDDLLGYVEKADIQQAGMDGNGKPIYDLMLDVIVRDEPKSIETYEAVTSGVKLGTSIGAKINPEGATRKPNGGYLFDDLNLLEASIVGIPQNPRSWVQYAVKSYIAAQAEDAETEYTNPDFVADTDQVTVDTEALAQVKEAGPEVAKDDAPNSVDEAPAATPEEEANEQPADDAGDDVAKDTEADVLKAEVSESDETPAQEVVETAPEHADETADESAVGDTLRQSSMVLADLVKSLTGETVDLRKQLAEAIAERDAALARANDAEANYTMAKGMVDRVLDTPLGRKAVFSEEEVTEFRKAAGGMYGDTIAKWLENSNGS